MALLAKKSGTTWTEKAKSRLERAGHRGSLVHRIHPEERRDAEAVEVVAGLLQACEDDVALEVIRGARRDRRPVASRASRWKGEALEVALLHPKYNSGRRGLVSLSGARDGVL